MVLADYAFKGTGKFIWSANLNTKDIITYFRDIFGDILAAWQHIVYKEPKNCFEALDLPITLNSLITIDGNPVLNLKAIDNSLKYIKQV